MAAYSAVNTVNNNVLQEPERDGKHECQDVLERRASYIADLDQKNGSLGNKPALCGRHANQGSIGMMG